jgi:hypothetical protein
MNKKQRAGKKSTRFKERRMGEFWSMLELFWRLLELNIEDSGCQD